jgi:dipeptidyl aminopeptidase/acylaminoacyl peptidase
VSALEPLDSRPCRTTLIRLNLKEFSMRAKWLVTSLIVCVGLAFAPISAQQPAPTAQTAAAAPAAPAAKKAMELGDILAWKSMGSGTLSNDGSWLAYRLTPLEGDSEFVIRSVTTDKEYRFPIGEVSGGGFMGMASPFSDDAKWAGITVSPTRAEAARLKKQRKAPHNKLRLLDLTTGKDITIDNVRRFAFAGERGGWLAIQKDPPDAPGGAPAAPPAGGAAGAGAAGGASDRPKGADLILRELATGRELNIGNVSEFAFNKTGRLLALVIDAADKAGNGVQLRWMDTATVTVLDSDKAGYEKLSWTEKGDALAVLKTVEDKGYQDKLYSVLGFTNFDPKSTPAIVFDPKAEKTFPAEMSVSPDRAPGWTDDLANLTFGIRTVRKKAEDKAAGDKPAAGAPEADKADEAADEKPDLIVWHHKDPRLQSQQQVEEDRDKRFSYLCLFRVADKAFVRLADEAVRDVTLPMAGSWAAGFDERGYEWQGSTEGRRFRDVYSIDMKTGAKTLLVKKSRWAFGQSPDGGRFLVYGDGHFSTCDLATAACTNITLGAPVSFVDVEDDHNVAQPPVPPVGWEKSGASVLLSDGWDVWKIPATGGAAVNLTGNGRKDGLRYQGRLRLDPEEKGIDLTAPQYFNTYGERTKKSGIARVSPGKPGADALLWDAVGYGRVGKAKNADRIVYSRETFTEAPELYASDLSFKAGPKLTDNGAQQKAFQWSAGAQLVDYTSAKGAKLQGALFLPAGYEKGKKYPTIVYIYEKLSQGLNRFSAPSANGFNPTVYTSNGYAVLMPDITYTLNDPGMSAVWCVLPALKAAIATGVVDGAKVGLQGHSWGGYQTSFLVTQTNAFAAAVAGAPLTNMISMYSLIYKNSGGGNMAIFESSQGRFRGGYWGDNWEAYVRNSPVFFAKNVTTPLIILHNDKDGAVDFTQGVEYYNTLRRMGKNVVMLEYVGENHGLAKPANQQDYTLRMKEFFDHFLMGKAAPKWYTDGVPRLQMEDHLKERAGMGKKKDAPKDAPKDPAKDAVKDAPKDKK